MQSINKENLPLRNETEVKPDEETEGEGALSYNFPLRVRKPIYSSTGGRERTPPSDHSI